MKDFGVRLTFIIKGESADEIAAQVARFMQAGVDGSDVDPGMAAIQVDALDEVLQENIAAREIKSEEIAARIKGARLS